MIFREKLHLVLYCQIKKRFWVFKSFSTNVRFRLAGSIYSGLLVTRVPSSNQKVANNTWHEKPEGWLPRFAVFVSLRGCSRLHWWLVGGGGWSLCFQRERERDVFVCVCIFVTLYLYWGYTPPPTPSVCSFFVVVFFLHWTCTALSTCNMYIS